MKRIHRISVKLLLVILLVVITILSVTYALLEFSVSANTESTQAGCFEVDYTGEVLTSNSLISTTDYTKGMHSTVTLKKNASCTAYTKASIHLKVGEENTTPLNEVKALKYKVMSGNEEISSGIVRDVNSLEPAPKDFTIVLATVNLTTTATTYDIYLWIDLDISFGQYNNTKFNGYIYVSSVQTSTIVPMNQFAEAIMIPNAVSDKDIDFSTTSAASNTNGIYYVEATKNDRFPIYYYRGNVDNNLLFAGFCWKVVRTTETGGLKLIYNGLPSNGICNNTGVSSQIGTKTFNPSSDSLTYSGYMYGSLYTINSKPMEDNGSILIFGNDVTYSDGTYSLVNTTDVDAWSDVYNGGLNDYHYTCFRGSGLCGDTVYYIYYTDSDRAYYITLTSGKTVEDALREMLDNNTISSTIKGDRNSVGTLENWYYTNIEQTGYSDYVEDTVWCNDRSISSLGGWDPNGGNTNSYLYFSARNRVSSTYMPSLVCSRNVDKFTVNELNGNGDLDYPVGLLTADEIMLAGGNYATSNETYYLNTGEWYLASITPDAIDASIMYNFGISNRGNLGGISTNSSFGFRPSISLANGFTLSGGNGTLESPYVIS